MSVRLVSQRDNVHACACKGHSFSFVSHIDKNMICFLHGRICVFTTISFLKYHVFSTEPTSALDQESAKKAERVLKESGAGLVWVTHDDTQPARVGGRVLSLPLGTEVRCPVAILLQRCTPAALSAK